MPKIDVRKEMPGVELTREQFSHRMREQFYDPAFDQLKSEIDKIIDVTWKAYDDSRKSPRTQKAGPGYADPDYELSVECRRSTLTSAIWSLMPPATQPSTRTQPCRKRHECGAGAGASCQANESRRIISTRQKPA